MKMFVSGSEKGFYAEGIGTLPADAVEISMELWQSLLEGQAAGDIIDFTLDVPSLRVRVQTHADQVLAAEQDKAIRLSSAQAEISLWQTKLQLGILSDGERSQLLKWIEYIDDVNLVNTNLAPDIEWPVKPE